MTADTEHISPEGVPAGLPAGLLRAISAPVGGKVALVVGAGCSVEAPTNIPVSAAWSRELHRLLVADRILSDGDCHNPNDLSCLADSVYSKTGSQKALVDRIIDIYPLQTAEPNHGHLVAAAMLFERAISSVVILNYDLAFTNALSYIGTRDNVRIIECPEHLDRQGTINLYYLHRNVNESDPDKWVLRTDAIEQEWAGHWEEIIATSILTAPVVVFVGLGTPVSVLLKSVELMHSALTLKEFYLVDPARKEDSEFFGNMGLDDSAYIQQGWCAFMEELSNRLSSEQLSALEKAVSGIVRENQVGNEDISGQLADLEALGLIGFGTLRSNWLLCDSRYCPLDSTASDLLADLILALSMVARISGTETRMTDDGVVEFSREGRVVAAFVIASGNGHRNKVAVEAKIAQRRRSFEHRTVQPLGAIVAGTSDSWDVSSTAPKDLVRGDTSKRDIISGSTHFSLIHVDELRNNTNRIMEVVS